MDQDVNSSAGSKDEGKAVTGTVEVSLLGPYSRKIEGGCSLCGKDVWYDPENYGVVYTCDCWSEPPKWRWAAIVLVTAVLLLLVRMVL